MSSAHAHAHKPDLRIVHPDDDACDSAGMAAKSGTLSWYWQRYHDHLEARVGAGEYNPRRFKTTRGYVRSFMRHAYRGRDGHKTHLGDLPAAEARQIHLTDWLLANYARWPSGATRADALGAILGCFAWLQEQGFLKQSPFIRPRKLRFKRQHRRAVRADHFWAIMRAARGPVRRDASGGFSAAALREFRHIFLAAWLSGCRLIELRLLQPRHIDFARANIRLEADEHKTGHQTGAAKIIGVGDRLLLLLRALCKRGGKYVFQTASGGPWHSDRLGRLYKLLREKAGVPAEFKMAGSRHGYAYRNLASGKMSTKQIADQFGHTTSRMVETIYGAETRYDGELVRHAANLGERGKPTRQKATAAKPPPSPLFDALE